jgi:hypothetical protein
LKEIYQQVYQKFPEVAGKTPVKYPQPNGHTLLVFKGHGTGPNGEKIARVVRVQVNENGKIVKITTSR